MTPAVWILGAGGFIGRAVARGWQAEGARVAGCGHGCAGISHDCVEGEIDAASFDALHARTGLPDIVYQLAGGSSVGASFADPDRDAALTLGSTDALIAWLTRHAPAAKVIAASSAAVYGEGHEGPIAEDAPLNPYSPYGAHKLQMEQLLNGSGLAVAIVRLFSVYGPGLRKQLLWDACGKLAHRPDRLDLGGTGKELRDFLHIDDTVDLLMRAEGAARHGGYIINGGTGMGTSVREVAETLCAAMQAPCEIAFSGAGRPGDPASLIADTTRSRALGFIPVRSPSEGFADYARWFASEAAS